MLDSLLPIANIDVDHLLGGECGKAGVDPCPGIPYILLQLFEGDLCFCFIAHDLALVEVEDVIGHSGVVLGGVDVPHDEDAVESGKDGRLELYLLGYLFEFVVPSVDGIGGCQDRGS